VSTRYQKEEEDTEKAEGYHRRDDGADDADADDDRGEC